MCQCTRGKGFERKAGKEDMKVGKEYVSEVGKKRNDRRKVETDKSELEGRGGRGRDE